MAKKKEKKGGYITRTQAVRYLQVSLADFRRLCILKGVYPRDLSGKAKKRIQKGSTKPLTAYYRKDIQYLAHEPLLEKFRAHKIFAKKLSKAIGRGDLGDAYRIDAQRPRYTLDHIIKERYPTFVDALGDLDDALSMLFLFAQMPATDKVSHRITSEAQRLTTEWTAYIAREHLLRKVFVSIKGIYYQAVVRGQEITWVVPHKFPHMVPNDVDFRIMLTFLEFYTTLVHFVLFKLYTDANLVYPPPINPKREKGVGGIGTYVLESKAKALNANAQATNAKSKSKSKAAKNQPDVQLQLDKAREADEEADERDDAQVSDEEYEVGDEDANKLDEFNAQAEGGDILLQPSAKQSDLLFSKFTFFVGREVSMDLMEFITLAQGGKIISEAAIDELVDNEDLKQSNDTSKIHLNLDTVTHHVCDRPTVAKKVPGRVYVQPQWLLDSINQDNLLPVGPYAPGEALPPHLSPWGDRGTYNPDEAAEEDEEEDDEEVEGAEDDANENDDEDEDEDEDEEAAEERAAQRELQLEAKGVKFSEAPSQKKRKAGSKKVDEEKELRKTMMSKKQRTLYDKVQGGIDQQEERKKQLQKRRKERR